MPPLPNLATQLNDLAVANSDGLLNDDEYRLLRQNLFERYSGGVEIFSVSPGPTTKLASAPPRRKHVELVEQPSPRTAQITPTRRKSSGVACFLRRATGWKSAPPSPAPASVIKLTLPRLFSKKPEASSLFDTDSSVTRSSSSPSFSRDGSNGDLHSKPPIRVPPAPTKADPTSPIRSNFDAPPLSPSRSTFGTAAQSRYDVIPGGSDDIFDDDNLQTSEAIRTAIAAVEAEERRLVTAFNDLETSAVIRYRQEHPPRQRSGSSTLLTTARRPSATPLSSPSSSHVKSLSRSNSQTPNPDTQSVRSGSSLRTSKSTTSLFHSAAPPAGPAPFSQSTPPPTSAWSALSPRRLPSLRRKGSVSSISSHGTSSFLGVRGATPVPSLSRGSSMSRSTGHLPLPTPGSGSSMMELLSHAHSPSEGGEELAEVRRRRTEMMGRCEARLEYLRAKLKGAQIREKLLKK